MAKKLLLTSIYFQNKHNLETWKQHKNKLKKKKKQWTEVHRKSDTNSKINSLLSWNRGFTQWCGSSSKSTIALIPWSKTINKAKECQLSTSISHLKPNGQ